MLLCLSLSLLIGSADAASILGFFPFPGRSHHILFSTLMSELAFRGHDVTYFTPIPAARTHPNLRQVLINNYGPEVLGTLDFIELGEMSMGSHMQAVYDKMYILLDKVLQEDKVKALIHSDEKYDAVILESFFFQEPNSALIHKFGSVGIDFMPLGDNVWINEIAGLATQYSYMNDYKTLLTDDMSFWERLYSTYTGWVLTATCYWNTVRMQQLMDKHYTYKGWESRPPLTRLMSNRSIILLNKNPLVGYPYPQPPHLKEVGGINVLQNSPLPKEIQDFMDNAADGVIYMSLGFNMEVSKVLKEKNGDFLSVFGSLKQKVLMKWESGDIGKLPHNVKIMNKFPQQDVLAHPKCILFITHGGYLSLSETVHHGVPIIGIPFYGDQPRNVLWAQKVGVGIYLDRTNLTKASIGWALNEILTNGRYTSKMRHRSRMVRDRRHSPMDEAIFWIEHAIKYPNSLTPKSAYQSFFVLHQIDVTLCLLGLFLTAATVAYKSFHFVLQHFRKHETLKIKIS